MTRTKGQWGSRTKKGEKKWLLRYRVGSVRRSETFHGTAREADRRLSELELKYGSSTGMTVGSFWETVFVPEAKRRVADGSLALSTLSGYESAMRTAVLPRFSDTLLDDVKSHDVQDWLSSMTKGRAKKSKSVFRLVMQRACDLDYVESHPLAKRYLMPSATSGRGRTKDVYSFDEMSRMFEECKGEPFEGPFILAAFGGAQRSEALGVRCEEIGFRSGCAVVPIKRNVQRMGGETVVTPHAKNEYREADVIVEAPFSNRLKELCDELGPGYLCDDGIDRDSPMNPDLMAKAWERWVGRTEHRYIPFGNFRNAYSTWLHDRGLDQATVSKLMRHSTLQTDYVYYNRQDSDSLINALKAC